MINKNFICKIVLGPMSDAELLHTPIELYCVVDYDSRWSTKFYKDCMFDFLYEFHF